MGAAPSLDMRTDQMIRILMFSLLLFAAPAFAAGLPDEPEHLLSEASGTLAIAADGSVERVELTTALDPAGERAVEALVGKWRFEPVIEDGRAVPATARVDLVLGARTDPATDKVRIGVQQANFFEEDRRLVGKPGFRVVPPKFPRHAHGRSGASILLRLEFAPDGTVARVGLAGGWVEGHAAESEKLARKWSAKFYEAAQEAAQQWVFPAASYGECAVLVPVRFSSRPDGWLLVRRLPADMVSGPGGNGCDGFVDAAGNPVSRRFVLLTPLPGLLPGRSSSD